MLPRQICATMCHTRGMCCCISFRTLTCTHALMRAGNYERKHARKHAQKHTHTHAGTHARTHAWHLKEGHIGDPRAVFEVHRKDSRSRERPHNPGHHDAVADRRQRSSAATQQPRWHGCGRVCRRAYRHTQLLKSSTSKMARHVWPFVCGHVRGYAHRHVATLSVVSLVDEVELVWRWP